MDRHDRDESLRGDEGTRMRYNEWPSATCEGEGERRYRFGGRVTVVERFEDWPEIGVRCDNVTFPSLLVDLQPSLITYFQRTHRCVVNLLIIAVCVRPHRS